MAHWSLKPKDFLCARLFKSNRLDVIICGVTSFMGRRVLQAAATTLKYHTWGVADSNLQSTKDLLMQLGITLNSDFISNDVPIFVVNLLDSNTLKDMTERCRVLINCATPYELYGEGIVQACIETDTSYLDLSIEIPFSEMIQHRYHEEARRKGVYIICGCGFNSFIIDFGICYLQREFNGTINSVEAYTQFCKGRSIPSVIGHRGLWQSLVWAFANVRNIRKVRQEMHRQPYPALYPKSTYNLEKALKRNTWGTGVTLPFPVVDQQVVERSQYYRFVEERKRPIQFHSYLIFSTVFWAVTFAVWFFIIGILAQLNFTRALILRFPRLFSLGYFSKTGPFIDDMQKLDFEITLIAWGWPIYAQTPGYDFGMMPTRSMTVTINGANPFYGVSCDCILASASTLLEECDLMPSYGGVYTPGIAFGKTNIIYELQRRGLVYYGDCEEYDVL